MVYRTKANDITRICQVCERVDFLDEWVEKFEYEFYNKNNRNYSHVVCDKPTCFEEFLLLYGIPKNEHEQYRR